MAARYRAKSDRKPKRPVKPAARLVSPEALGRARYAKERKAGNDAAWKGAFKPYEPPPGVLPKGMTANQAQVGNAKGLAQDAAAGGVNPALGWAANNIYGLAFAEGYTFMGYPYLAALAQIPEYRIMSDVRATEMTRKWIEIQATDPEDDAAGNEDLDDLVSAVGAQALLAVGAADAEPDDEETEPPGMGHNGGPELDEDDRDLSKDIEELEAEFERLNVRGTFKMIAEQDGWFGRSHLYIDTGEEGDALKTPIGEGDEFTEALFEGKIGFLKSIKTIEPLWAYPVRYNSSNPLKDDWYKPSLWYVMAQEIHSSRFLTFVGRPVPDIFKPAYAFGGLSLSQMAKPYVDNWLQTRTNINRIIQAFTVWVLKTNMSTLLQQDSYESLDHRAEQFNLMQNNFGLMMLDKDEEEFENVAAPLAGLHELQAQSQEHMFSVSQTPAVKFAGIQPAGLNASSDGEIRVFYDTIHAFQEWLFKKHLDVIFRLAQINLWGKVNKRLHYIFKPLHELSELEEADMRKTEADTAAVYIDKGVTSPEDERKRLASDADAPYANLDVSDLPAPAAPEPEHITSKTTEEENAPDMFGAGGGKKTTEEHAVPKSMVPGGGDSKGKRGRVKAKRRAAS